MITDYLRRVVERLSRFPASVQDRYAAQIEVDLNQSEQVKQSERATAQEASPTEEPIYDPATDPLALFIGSAHSGTPDLAKRHDAYLAEAYADDHGE